MIYNVDVMHIQKYKIGGLQMKRISALLLIGCMCLSTAMVSNAESKNDRDLQAAFEENYEPIDGTAEEEYNHFMQTLDEFVRTLPETTDGISEISRDELNIIVDEAFRGDANGAVTYAFTETADKTLLCSVLSKNDV